MGSKEVPISVLLIPWQGANFLSYLKLLTQYFLGRGGGGGRGKPGGEGGRGAGGERGGGGREGGEERGKGRQAETELSTCPTYGGVRAELWLGAGREAGADGASIQDTRSFSARFSGAKVSHFFSCGFHSSTACNRWFRMRQSLLTAG